MVNGIVYFIYDRLYSERLIKRFIINVSKKKMQGITIVQLRFPYFAFKCKFRGARKR